MQLRVTGCRALVGGFGVPTQRDLDFGRQVIRYLEPFTWPEGVVVEDLSYAAHLVLHRLHELHPPKLVLVGAAPSGEDPPGTVRRRRVDRAAKTACGATDLQHTLNLLRRFGGLPSDTVLIEVEPADCSFGLGFSEDLAASFDTIVDMIREEVDFEDVAPPAPAPATSPGPAPAPMDSLVAYAADRREARFHERQRGGLLVAPPRHAGIEVVTRSTSCAIGLQSGSDWSDVIPLAGDRVAVVMGDVPGRGVEAAALKSDLRVAVQAYAVLAGDSPATMIECLDRLVTTTGRGQTTTLVYLTLDRRTGDVRLCSAGHCPPLVVGVPGTPPRYLHDDFTPALGMAGVRQERTGRLERGEALLLFTDGLVERSNRPLALGLLDLADATSFAPAPLDALCDHVLATCFDRQRREDDLSLLALRRT